MKIIHYPNKKAVEEALQIDDPLLMLVKHDLSEIVLSNIDDAGEHLLLLRLINHKESDLDNYFRVIVNNDGADWTFVCPNNYKNIENKNYRIEQFYNDGINIISKALKEINYEVEINIPKRYRRHFNMLDNND